MTSIPLDTHKAIKQLTSSGVDEKQAEAMVQLFSDTFSNNVATTSDIKVLHEELKSDLAQVNGNIEVVKNDFAWIKKLLFAIAIPVFIASVKYIFS